MICGWDKRVSFVILLYSFFSCTDVIDRAATLLGKSLEKSILFSRTWNYYYYTTPSFSGQPGSAGTRKVNQSGFK